ncbi:MAG: glycoside hydrolase family 28 protein [Lactobacillaceae bacterium]|jgi:polygalacturonase|nr:glycoside hydrolase family 28 protein [Lactobacillaceae bacterium]
MDIQAEINLIELRGGGELVIPAGVHQTGPLTLCSNLTIIFADNARVQFIPDPNLYPPVWTRWEGVECYAMHPLVFANECENIKLLGSRKTPIKSFGDENDLMQNENFHQAKSGTDTKQQVGILDGNGATWWDLFRAHKTNNQTEPTYPYEIELAKLNPDYLTQPGGGGGRENQFLRPPLLQLYKCKNVEISGFNLVNSPFWTLHTVYSEDITIENMAIINPDNSINTDAIDIDSSTQVNIVGSCLDVGDDAITLKSGSGADGLRVNRPTQNVKVDNCVIYASHGGITIGSETAGGISDVTADDCTFLGTQRAIRIKTRRTRGGVIENIKLNNLKMKRCWCPIAISQFYQPGVNLKNAKEAWILSKEEQPISELTPIIRNVTIKNIEASNCLATAAFIVGLPEQPITQLTIENFKWELAPSDELLPTSEAEMTGGLFNDENRGIKIINAVYG